MTPEYYEHLNCITNGALCKSGCVYCGGVNHG